MKGQCYSFSSKMKLGRFYTVLVCSYQECTLGLGNGGLLQGIHATWDLGAMETFVESPCHL